MAQNFIYNSSQVIMATTVVAKRHFLRTGGASATGTTIIDTNASGYYTAFKTVSSSTWSRRTKGLTKGTTYTSNYATGTVDNWQGSFTFTPTATLKTTANMWSFTYNSTTSVTVKLQGWGGSFSGSESWPYITVKVGTTSKYTTLDDWMSDGMTFTGLTAGTKYTVTATIGTPSWDIGSTSITMPTKPTISSYSASGASTSSIKVSYSISNATSATLWYGTSASSRTNSVSLSTSSTSKTITGLSAGTTYSFQIVAYNDYGSTTSSAFSGTTLMPSVGTCSASAASTTSLTITYSVSNASSATMWWKVRGSSGSSSGLSLSTSGTTTTLSGLSPGTQYQMYVTAYGPSSSTTSDDVTGSTFYGTTYSNPTISGPSSITTGSSSITFSYSVSNATTVRLYYGTSSSSMTSYKTLSTSSTSYTLSGLSENTTYYMYLYASSTTTGGTATGSTVSATTSSNKPDLWSWTASNGSATATQTSTARTAVTSNGYVTSFSYLVWNDMCDKVQAVLDCAGITWSTHYGLTLAQTKMTTSSKVMTAARFNSLRYNVGSNYSTGISEVSTGDIIYGSYFTTLMTKVNEWINSL